MYSLDGRHNAVKFLICLRGHVHDGRVHVRSPAGIAVAVCYLGAGHSEQGLNLVGYIPLARLNRRTLAGGNQNLIVGLHLHRSKVCGGFNQTLEGTAHRNHTVRRAVQSLNQTTGGVAVDSKVRTVDTLQLQFQTRLDIAVFAFNIGHIIIKGHTYLLLVGSMYTEYGVGSTRNSITQVAAVDFAQTQFVGLHQSPQEAGHKLVGIGAAKMDVATGVTTQTLADIELEIMEIGRSHRTVIVESTGSVDTAGAAHKEFSIVL